MMSSTSAHLTQPSCTPAPGNCSEVSLILPAATSAAAVLLLLVLIVIFVIVICIITQRRKSRKSLTTHRLSKERKLSDSLKDDPHQFAVNQREEGEVASENSSVSKIAIREALYHHYDMSDKWRSEEDDIDMLDDDFWGGSGDADGYAMVDSWNISSATRYQPTSNSRSRVLKDAKATTSSQRDTPHKQVPQDTSSALPLIDHARKSPSGTKTAAKKKVTWREPDPSDLTYDIVGYPSRPPNGCSRLIQSHPAHSVSVPHEDHIYSAVDKTRKMCASFKKPPAAGLTPSTVHIPSAVDKTHKVSAFASRSPSADLTHSINATHEYSEIDELKRDDGKSDDMDVLDDDYWGGSGTVEEDATSESQNMTSTSTAKGAVLTEVTWMHPSTIHHRYDSCNEGNGTSASGEGDHHEAVDHWQQDKEPYSLPPDGVSKGKHPAGKGGTSPPISSDTAGSGILGQETDALPWDDAYALPPDCKLSEEASAMDRRHRVLKDASQGNATHKQTPQGSSSTLPIVDHTYAFLAAINATGQKKVKWREPGLGDFTYETVDHPSSLPALAIAAQPPKHNSPCKPSPPPPRVSTPNKDHIYSAVDKTHKLSASTRMPPPSTLTHRIDVTGAFSEVDMLEKEDRESDDMDALDDGFWGGSGNVEGDTMTELQSIPSTIIGKGGCPHTGGYYGQH